MRIAATISSKVRSGCSATRANSHSTCSSNGDVLPPLSFALVLPLSRQRCNHLTAELALRLKLSAASRRDAPATTASITRSRKSSEWGFGIDLVPPEPRINAARLAHSRTIGNPRFNSAGKRSNNNTLNGLPVQFPGCKPLTKREGEVLARLVTGASSKEAAAQLGISPRTIEIHRAHIMGKLGAKNIADLVRIVMSERHSS